MRETENKDRESGKSLLRDLTFPSIIETHELVVPKSIPIMSFPAAFALKAVTNINVE